MFAHSRKNCLSQFRSNTVKNVRVDQIKFVQRRSSCVQAFKERQTNDDDDVRFRISKASNVYFCSIVRSIQYYLSHIQNERKPKINRKTYSLSTVIECCNNLDTSDYFIFSISLLLVFQMVKSMLMDRISRGFFFVSLRFNFVSSKNGVKKKSTFD